MRAERAATGLVCADRARGGIAHEDNRAPVDRVVQDRLVREQVEGPGFLSLPEAQREDIVLRGEALVVNPRGEHQVGAFEVGAVGPARRVVAVEAGLDGQDGRVGVTRQPFRPARDGDGADLERYAGPDERARDGLAGKLIPQCVGLPVEHQLVGTIQETGRAELEGLVTARDGSPEENAGTAQGAVCERDRYAADHVVEHLVPIHHPKRIGTGVAVDLHPEDEFVRCDVVGFIGRDEGRIDQCRDAVLDDAAPHNFLEADRVGNSRVEERAEVRVDMGVHPRLVGVETLERNNVRPSLLPEHPAVPAGPVVLASEGLERVDDRPWILPEEPERLDQRGHHVRVAAIHEVRHQAVALQRAHLEDLPGDILYLGIAELSTLRG